MALQQHNSDSCAKVYSLGKLGYSPAGGLMEAIGDYVEHLAKASENPGVSRCFNVELWLSTSSSGPAVMGK